MIKVEDNKIMYINESEKSPKESSLKLEILRFYLHCIKWCTQPEKRTDSWVHSIYDAMITFKFSIDNRVCLKITENDFIKLYNKAKIEASDETGIDKRLLPNLLNDYYWLTDISKISDTDIISKFLKSYCNTSDSKYLLWLEFIEKEEKYFYNQTQKRG